jgi:hypothetical protein
MTYKIRSEVDYLFVGEKQLYIFKTDDKVFIIFFLISNLFVCLFFFRQYLILEGIRLCFGERYWGYKVY